MPWWRYQRTVQKLLLKLLKNAFQGKKDGSWKGKDSNPCIHPIFMHIQKMKYYWKKGLLPDYPSAILRPIGLCLVFILDSLSLNRWRRWQQNHPLSRHVTEHANVWEWCSLALFPCLLLVRFYRQLQQEGRRAPRPMKVSTEAGF